MSRIRRDVKDTVDARLFQRVGVRLRVSAKAAATAALVAAEFAAAVADEYQLYLLCKTGRIFDIVRGDGSAAEETDVGKYIEMLKRNRLRLHSAHGEAGHGAMGLIGERAEIGVDVWDQLVDENRLEWRDTETCRCLRS